MSVVSKDGGVRLMIAWIALLAALFLPLWFFGAGLGTKWGLWSWQFGLGKMFMAWGPIVIGVAAVIGVLALILGLIKSPRGKPVFLACLSLFIVGMVGGRLGFLANVAVSLPPIHDVQTDWSDPVRFSEAMMKERAKTEGVNPVEDDPKISERAAAKWPDMVGRRVADVQAERYEPIQTMISNVTPEQMYTAAYLTLNDLGIEIITEDEENFRLEGTYTTKLFGFKDDVAIRIRPKGQGSELDVRSVSRVGLSDVGVNFERVYAILQRIELRLDQLKAAPAE